MKQLIRNISELQQSLRETPFIRWLGDKTIRPQEKFTFAPSMVFFIMGFKDIMHFLKYPEPNTDAERHVNQHCDEDAGHWEWYLKDLERLGYDFSSWGSDLTSFFNSLWSDDNQACRRLVYSTLHYKSCTDDAAVRLVIIEVMEATFGVFMDALHASTYHTQVYSDLEFFGEKHRQAEHSHSMGSWVDGEHLSLDLTQIRLTPDSRRLAIRIVDDLFQQFDDMFGQWHSQCLHVSPPRYNSLPPLSQETAI